MTDPIKCHVEKSSIKFKIVTVTPELARKWLDTRNLNNRFIRKAKIMNCGRDMMEGRWRDNAEVIKLAPDGELLDGVHRCMAIEENNLEINMRVAFGVPKEVMPTIDTGTARSFADYLRIAGEENVIVQAGVARRYTLWKRGLREVRKMRGQLTPTLSMLKEMYEQHQNEIRYSAKIAGDIHRRTQFVSKSSGGLFFMLTAEIDLDQATEFKDRLMDGTNLSEHNPIAVARRRLFSYSANNLTDTDRLAILIHAWNFWRQEKTADTIHLVYNEAGAGSRLPLNNTNFPAPA